MSIPLKRCYTYTALSVMGLLLTFIFTLSVIAKPEISQPRTDSVINNKFADHFINLLRNSDHSESQEALTYIKENWHMGLVPMAMESLWFSSSTAINDELKVLIQQSIKSDYSHDLNDWYFELWNKDIQADNSYANFKARLYREIDPRFETYFKNRQATAQVRLDEMRWGGVLQDGIPPLRNPEMIPATQASYLEWIADVVRGPSRNREARQHLRDSSLCQGPAVEGVSARSLARGTGVPPRAGTRNDLFIHRDG